METPLYLDVLLVINYLVTALLLAGMSRLLGTAIPRRRMIGAALLGAVGSLVIFLPFTSFFAMLGYRVLLSAGIVMAALPWEGWVRFLKGWFVFFAVSFFFAGVMLGIWLLFSPSGMVYHGGVVYFNLNPITLLISTAVAYLLLGLIGRLTRGGRVSGTTCKVTVKLSGRRCTLPALIDTGNSLYEPFSGIPVIVCPLDAVASILPPGMATSIRAGDLGGVKQAGVRIRLIPYAALGKTGTLPALRVDELIIRQESALYKAELCYMAVSAEKLGEGGGQAILNPDLIGRKLKTECGVNV
ncbi:MAG: sigma-E processing peptidase SpoIIGA [Oscillospiraceae bacterium]|nr:sigma-E processing peptidase SpoIIGA [Oscillospiraceae bacterium]